EIGLSRLLLAFLQTALVAFAVAAVSMVTAVWGRHTRGAILACYSIFIIIYLGKLMLLGNLSIPLWLNLFDIFSKLYLPPLANWTTVVLHFAAWAGAGSLCLALAMASLRYACLRQIEARPHRWLWAFRSAVGDDPIRWRERHVIGLAPLPWLRLIPTWMAR